MKLLRWIKERLHHKLENLKWSNIKKTFRENGLALVVIIVCWEIVEDVVFPAIFALLGNYVHPAFFTGIPVAWVVCLHWFMVPVLWGVWIKIKKGEKELNHDCGGCDESR
jgi:hypothetical protein